MSTLPRIDVMTSNPIDEALPPRVPPGRVARLRPNIQMLLGYIQEVAIPDWDGSKLDLTYINPANTQLQHDAGVALALYGRWRRAFNNHRDGIRRPVPNQSAHLVTVGTGQVKYCLHVCYQSAKDLGRQETWRSELRGAYRLITDHTPTDAVVMTLMGDGEFGYPTEMSNMKVT